MAMADFIPVMVRYRQFREKHKDESPLVKTSCQVDFERSAVIFKTEIFLNEKLVATGHAYANLTDEKDFEKNETTSVGRALNFLGFYSEDKEENDETSTPSQKTSSKGLGLGAKKAPAAAAPQEEQQAEAPPAKPKLALKPILAKPTPKVEVVAYEEASDEPDASYEIEIKDADSALEPEISAARPAIPTTTNTKLSGVMAKYGLGANKKAQ